MIIDFIFAILLLWAAFKGFKNGFIVALFSLAALIIGLAAALKLSVVVSEYLATSTQSSSRWWPFISFILVFILVVILVKLGAKLLQKSVELLWLGWANRLAGIAFYVILFSFIYSIILFYLVQLKLLSAETTAQSVTYSVLAPIGPMVIDGLGAVIPLFKNIFTQLQNFFQQLSHTAPVAV